MLLPFGTDAQKQRFLPRIYKGEDFARNWQRALKANEPRTYLNNPAAVQAVANEEVEVAFLFNPRLSARELLESILVELGVEKEGQSARELVDALNHFLLEKHAAGKRVLLIVDEAQGLLPETLEQIRLLSNLETESTKLIQILLLGQPELDAMLESPELRQRLDPSRDDNRPARGRAVAGQG